LWIKTSNSSVGLWLWKDWSSKEHDKFFDWALTRLFVLMVGVASQRRHDAKIKNAHFKLTAAFGRCLPSLPSEFWRVFQELNPRSTLDKFVQLPPLPEHLDGFTA